MTRFTRSARLFVLALLICAGCARVPPAGDPISRAELTDLAASLDSHLADGSALRGSGKGEVVMGGRRLKFVFALVYSRPAWLRADLRPELGIMGTSLTALATIEDDCARAYFPARLTLVEGCFEDVFGGVRTEDPAAFLVGLPDARFLARLEDATALWDEELIVVRGSLADRPVSVEIDPVLSTVTRIDIGRADEDERVTIVYGDHGWKAGLAAPRTIEMTAFERTSREMKVKLRFESLKTSDPVRREDFALEIPPGVRVLDWEDLLSWGN